MKRWGPPDCNAFVKRLGELQRTDPNGGRQRGWPQPSEGSEAVESTVPFPVALAQPPGGTSGFQQENAGGLGGKGRPSSTPLRCAFLLRLTQGEFGVYLLGNKLLWPLRRASVPQNNGIPRRVTVTEPEAGLGAGQCLEEPR